MSSYQDTAAELRTARLSGKAISAFSSRGVQLSPEDGYQVQAELLSYDLTQGEKLVGYKMGLTSKAKQRDVNVHEPICGYLLHSYEIQKGGFIRADSRIHPRVEPELAVVLKKNLRGGSLRDVREAIGFVFPALEIVDSRYEAFKFQLGEVIADNTSAAHFMVGGYNYAEALSDLRLLGVVVRKNGEIIETGAPAAVLNDPLLSVLVLAQVLEKRGEEIKAGQIILTGGITNSVPFTRGDTLSIEWPHEHLAFTCQ